MMHNYTDKRTHKRNVIEFLLHCVFIFRSLDSVVYLPLIEIDLSSSVSLTILLVSVSASGFFVILMTGVGQVVVLYSPCLHV